MERTVIRMNGQEQLKELEQKLGYAYRDQNLLERALTHSSYANERQVPYGSNERLEFLGLFLPPFFSSAGGQADEAARGYGM